MKVSSELLTVTCLRLLRLSVIDESSFLSHSDISYDRTDDEVVRAVTRLCAGLKQLDVFTESLNVVAGFGLNCDQTSEVPSQREEGESFSCSNCSTEA